MIDCKYVLTNKFYYFYRGKMIPVLLESPFKNPDPQQHLENIHYARQCLKDCLNHNESAMASHLLYTQVLNDHEPEERNQGIEAGLVWQTLVKKVVVYYDRGISTGMKLSIQRALKNNIPIEYKSLYSGVFKYKNE